MIALEVEKQKADTQAADRQIDAEIEKYKADLEARVKEYQTQANQELQLALAQIKAGQAVDLETTRAMLKVDPTATNGGGGSLTSTLASMADAIKQANGAKRVVRDEKGKVVGVEPV